VIKLDADTISDAQIEVLRDALFAGPADARALHGLVSCWAALGRSHRRRAARAHCAALINEANRKACPKAQ
jgi:hypothetical protein